jgi:hypothetical protein
MPDTKLIANACCCCEDGALVQLWRNDTKVRRATFTNGTDATGGLTIDEAAAPFTRHEVVEYANANAPKSCNDLPPGECNPWLAASIGDFNGVSAQEVTAGTDDLKPCAAPDENHQTVERNCYTHPPPPELADMRMRRTDDNPYGGRFGAGWLLAQKQHHGVLGFKDKDYPHIILSVAFDAGTVAAGHTGFGALTYTDTNVVNFPPAPQHRYLQIHSSIDAKGATAIGGVPPGDPYAGTILELTAAVNRHSGIETRTAQKTNVGTGADVIATDAFDATNPATVSFNAIAGLFATFQFNSEATKYEHAGSTYKLYRIDPFTGVETLFETVIFDPANGLFSREVRFSTFLGEIIEQSSYSVANAGITYHVFYQNPVTAGYVADVEITLSDAYTGGDLLQDAYEQADSWLLSDFSLAHLRHDEKLALAPLVVRDEVPTGIEPHLEYNPVMEDFSGAQDAPDGSGRNPGDAGYVPTWHLRGWLDPNDYIWRWHNIPFSTNTPPPGFSGGATLETGRRTGNIVAHTAAGSDKHFWWGAKVYVREPIYISGVLAGYDWLLTGYGDYAPAGLPAPTMRWLPHFNAEYDPANPGGAAAPPGNLPQNFIRQIGTEMFVGKYVEAVQNWDAVNTGRPCGPDKYAVDQPTVCCVLDGSTPGSSATNGTYLVKATGNANLPLRAGGLANSDYIIISGDGVYRITGIADNGEMHMAGGKVYQQFTVTTGHKLDDIPTGWAISPRAGNYLGKLRWPSFPGICGRVAVTTDAAGTAITSATPQPYLRLDPVQTQIVVEFYDDSMNRIATNVHLARADDRHWTAATPVPGAVWMTAPGGKWADYQKITRGTFVKLEWTFDMRKAQFPTAAQPKWLGGTAAGDGTGLIGCTGLDISQQSYSLITCKPIIGFVPYHSTGGTYGALENFRFQKLFPMPLDFLFQIDPVFGSYWMGAVETTMVDPFWQPPFKPDCDFDLNDVLHWKEDDGSGQTDIGPDTNDAGGETSTWYYPHRPLVEAASTVPAGQTLAGGVTLFYAPGSVIQPDPWPHGIQYAADYTDVWRPYGFLKRACENIRGGTGNFSAEYSDFCHCP